MFLQARDKEDMRRNSVVSVFLRVLEYYSGILFLTTNKVGHFDEAFKSRIHVALYYPPLDEQSAMQIWKMNLRRLIEQRRNFDADVKGITKYAKRHYRTLEKSKRATWNGRQIKNAFQTAIALAEFDAKTERSKPLLSVKHFEVVARASEGFDYYLSMIHGADADRAKREGMRFDDPRDMMSRPTLLPSTPKSANRYASSDSSSSEESDAKEKEKKKRKKEKKEKGRKKKARAVESDSDDSSSD